MSFEPVRGTRDILPDDVARWRRIEETFRDVARRYNYREIRFPILEQTELFTRGIGETTDVVGKEMYTFPDRKGRSLTLRPEGTASAARAYLNHGFHIRDPFQKWFYLGPMFRYEKPQKGRFRQFHQYGVEALGSLDPSLDVEVISLAWALMNAFGLGGLWLRLNSIGCAEDRARYQEVLRDHFGDSIEEMCPDCRRRHAENPLRILDCKDERCQPLIEQAPGSADHLCPDCADHFATVRRYLDDLELPYRIDPRLVRGLDYYTRTVFELISDELGAQDSLLGGGRYDGLIETVGGPPTPAVGFAGGTDRLAIVLESREGEEADALSLDLFVASLGTDGRALALRLTDRLRRLGLSVDVDHRDRGLRKQLAEANRLGARHLVVIGDDEVRTSRGRLKAMASGEESAVDLTVDALREAVKRAGG